MITEIIVLSTLLLIEYFFSPRFDMTKDAKLLIWYGRKERKYIVIIE